MADRRQIAVEGFRLPRDRLAIATHGFRFGTIVPPPVIRGARRPLSRTNIRHQPIASVRVKC